MSGKSNVRRIVAGIMTIMVLSDGVAFGWSEIGHRAMASLAYALLDPQTRSVTADLLRQHPRFADDFAAMMPEEMRSADRAVQDEWIFQQAAVWPDIARRLPGNEDEGPQAEFSRPTWHYINQPLYLTDSDRTSLENHLPANLSRDVPADAAALREMNVVQAIRHCETVVGDPSRADAERAVHLAWLFHLVGDVHQPMHSTALFSVDRFPEGDKGGNLIRTRQNDNLHAVWDRFPGGEGERRVGTFADFAAARGMATGLLAGLPNEEANDDRDGDVETWLSESRELAENAAYTSEVLAFVRSLPPAPGEATPRLVLSEEYLEYGRKASARRLNAAGARLAKLLGRL
ncbi:MAG: S1/P1 nuclease [Planctomycetaceae bacterium]|nr:S1/P1 nuclease [Planctomycetaceae bacterium]